jgi:hypothetical protein
MQCDNIFALCRYVGDRFCRTCQDHYKIIKSGEVVTTAGDVGINRYSYKTSFHKTSSCSKRPFYKTSFHKTSFHRTSRLQNVLAFKTSSSTKHPAHKMSFPQNVLTYKTSLPSKRPSTKRPSLCHSTKRPLIISLDLC